ncbi:hypothetical protein [Methylocella sp.]
MLLKTVESKKVDPGLLATRRFAPDDILEACDTFGRAADSKALKVAISP